MYMYRPILRSFVEIKSFDISEFNNGTKLIWPIQMFIKPCVYFFNAKAGGCGTRLALGELGEHQAKALACQARLGNSARINRWDIFFSFNPFIT